MFIKTVKDVSLLTLSIFIKDVLCLWKMFMCIKDIHVYERSISIKCLWVLKMFMFIKDHIFRNNRKERLGIPSASEYRATHNFDQQRPAQTVSDEGGFVPSILYVDYFIQKSGKYIVFGRERHVSGHQIFLFLFLLPCWLPLSLNRRTRRYSCMIESSSERTSERKIERGRKTRGYLCRLVCSAPPALWQGRGNLGILQVVDLRENDVEMVLFTNSLVIIYEITLPNGLRINPILC